jgi:outer membrane protein assembly factor BamB
MPPLQLGYLKPGIARTSAVLAVTLGLIAASATAATATTFSNTGLVARAQAAPTAPSSNATAFQVNPAHDGEQDDSLKPPLAELWSKPFVAQSYPLIVNGVVYVLESDDLVALNEANGNIVWGPIGVGGLPVGMTEDGGQIFVQVGGVITAYSATTGAQGWSSLMPFQWGFSSYPTAYNGYVYTGGAGSGGTLYAVNEASGAVVWTAQVENGDSSSPAVNNSGVYVDYACNQTYDFNPTTGSSIWHYSGACEGGGGSNTALYGNALFAPGVPFSTGVVLNAKTGGLIAPLDSSTIPPAFSGSTAILNENGTLNAEDLQTRQVVWTFAGDGDLGGNLPVTDAGTVYVASNGNHLYALDAATGGLLGTYSLAAAPSQSLAVGDDVLVVPTSSDVEVFGHTSGAAPAITSAAGATFTTSQTDSFSFTTTGTPAPTVTETGALPSGVNFDNNNPGSAELTGTPAPGTGGVYPITVTASNGVPPNAVQSFTLTVDQPPAFTSPDSAGATVGQPFTFDVTTSGYPSPNLSAKGKLAPGLEASPTGNGDAVISGRPTEAGTYSVNIYALNGVAPSAEQTLTITVAKSS